MTNYNHKIFFQIKVKDERFTSSMFFSDFIGIKNRIHLSYRVGIRNDKMYAFTSLRKKKYYIHRLVLNASNGLCVDHINGDTLNNCRDNLRLCSVSENAQNRFYTKNKDSTSKYKGVSIYRKTGSFRARITINGKQKTIGYFKREEEAMEAYCKYANNLFGEFANTSI